MSAQPLSNAILLQLQRQVADDVSQLVARIAINAVDMADTSRTAAVSRQRFERVADKILRGILVHGFENDLEIQRVLDRTHKAVTNTLMHEFAEPEGRGTNPAQTRVPTEKPKSEAIVDRGELVESIKLYLRSPLPIKPDEQAEMIADAVIRKLGGKQ